MKVSHTLEDLKNAMKIAYQQPGFEKFAPSIEKQLMQETFTKLFFRVDVSGGSKQAFLLKWIKI